ncbi:BnaA01g33310D [Brassica napus]|uniref:BnaA01g33310D protein n=1 Tax=Brassica napus TaxID=3708 RepID=A0A078HB29_BRANA|nr:BnaA01g33310D [Brassica napus]
MQDILKRMVLFCKAAAEVPWYVPVEVSAMEMAIWLSSQWWCCFFYVLWCYKIWF